MRDFSGGVTDDLIDKEQSKLNLPISGTYREFIRVFGSQIDEGFIGIDKLYNNFVSEYSAKHWELGLPRTHIHVCMEDCECFSLNTTEPTEVGEFKVYRSIFPDYKSIEPYADSFGELFEKRMGLWNLVIEAMRENKGIRNP